MNIQRSIPSRLLVLAIAIAFLATAGMASAAERTFSQTYDLASGGNISLDNINGDVTIEGTSGNQVIVDAVISSRSAEALDEVEIEVDASSNSISISTEYDNSRKNRRNSASVDYTLRVPRDANLNEISLVNGSLEIQDVAGDVEASLVNGNLVAKGLAGDAELDTVNGSLEVHFDRLDSNQRIEMDSVNGSLDLYVPAGIGATVDASTLHGRMSNDFGIEVDKSGYVGKEMKGTIGGGGARISLDSVNGAITLHQR